MVRLLEPDPGVLPGASLRFAAVETPDGHVTVTWADHAAAFARCDDPALVELGRELATICEAVLTRTLVLGRTPADTKARPWMNRRGTVAADPEPRRIEQATLAQMAKRSSPALWPGLRRGVSRRCPACGEGRLFCGYLAVIPACSVCANDNEQYPSDDFAPYVTMFLVLHLMVPILLIADRAWNAPMGLELALALPLFAAATLLLLPFAKGGVIGFAWSRGVTRAPVTITGLDGSG
ncbi:DUF983 domain-containing protein [Dankookia rubra]|uniref:DUF983 domain-containing protein n=1 Tax=Dankookia rubra TaxID=1442381 RepID=A0A4R5QKK1_9PROT|nr:DUF983 domain-containing protein [Dankookia rubra]TDH63613.1 DUF983 domain-containing protein [Dankookia rubra]